MEQTARTSLRVTGLRPLGLPSPIVVELDRHGLPRRLRRQRRTAHPRTFRTAHSSQPPDPSVAGPLITVVDVNEVWRIAEEWWRERPIHRTYFRIFTADGRSLTIFRDGDPAAPAGINTPPGWFEQRY